MKIVDANIILRYLLNDTEELAIKAAEILENNKVYIPNEVMAEVVYVLEKVYEVKNDEISNILNDFVQYENVKVAEVEVIQEALKLYGERKLDFVDTLLFAYNKVKDYEVYTFDKKLNKLLNTVSF